MGFCTSYLHVRSTWFLTGKNTKKKQKKKIQKKNNFIYALHFFVSLTFCTYLKRLTSVSGLTEQISRSAEILYNMYMYFYSYAYKYMSVICLLCPVSFILSSLSRTWGDEKAFWEKHLSEGKTFSATPSINTRVFWGVGVRSLLQIDQKKVYPWILCPQQYCKQTKALDILTFSNPVRRCKHFNLILVCIEQHKAWIDVPLGH